MLYSYFCCVSIKGFFPHPRNPFTQPPSRENLQGKFIPFLVGFDYVGDVATTWGVVFGYSRPPSLLSLSLLLLKLLAYFQWLVAELKYLRRILPHPTPPTPFPFFRQWSFLFNIRLTELESAPPADVCFPHDANLISIYRHTWRRWRSSRDDTGFSFNTTQPAAWRLAPRVLIDWPSSVVGLRRLTVFYFRFNAGLEGVSGTGWLLIWMLASRSWKRLRGETSSHPRLPGRGRHPLCSQLHKICMRMINLKSRPCKRERKRTSVSSHSHLGINSPVFET